MRSSGIEAGIEPTRVPTLVTTENRTKRADVQTQR